ncbi:MarR family winged helix-turn-helix transcriptional regulator [Luteitalea sp.]|jgi:DNA-binding MarR family transcriptional regulator|uniref:MarR family winged helix-turn-helix transcriptional regulator n=1 Tax=Luteitalea sp. TaxID=2004800 RepID=UPI0037CC60B6
MQTDLQAELKQTRPFRSPVEELFVGLQRTAAVLEHAFETALKPSGTTSTQYNVLRILRGAGDQGLCRTEVGARMVRRVPDVTRLLDRMEEAGYIARTRGGDDRRYVTTRITPAGLQILAELDRVVLAFLDRYTDVIDAHTLPVLNEGLSALRRATDRS